MFGENLDGLVAVFIGMSCSDLDLATGRSPFVNQLSYQRIVLIGNCRERLFLFLYAFFKHASKQDDF